MKFWEIESQTNDNKGKLCGAYTRFLKRSFLDQRALKCKDPLQT